MNESVLIAVIVAIPPTLLAGAGIVIAWINNRVAAAKINHVTELTNSTLTEAKKHIERLKEQVEELENELASLRAEQ